ncbi:MAG TPA: sulfite exporter TauE/SafE family protein [Spirochaetia bacterium]|nr:sulfite exporter TauE/SafE family protein [Spirochaetia bacterium]
MMHITLVTALELIGLGLVVGAVSPTFGIGGGLLTVPLLILLFGFTSNAATATSLGVILFTSIAGTIAYIRERKIDYKVALYFMICAVPGSVAGALVSRWIKALHLRIDLLQIIFAGIMALTAIYKIVTILNDRRSTRSAAQQSAAPGGRGYLQRRIVDRRGKEFLYSAKLFPGIALAFIGGFIGAMLGLGGGIIYVPILTMGLGMPAAIATATSTFTILAVNPFALLIRLQSVEWSWVLLLAVGVVVSATLVPRILHKINDRWILTGFWTLAILAAVRLILNVAGMGI